MNYILGYWNFSTKKDERDSYDFPLKKERQKINRKFSHFFMATSIFFQAEAIIKLLYREYDFVVYAGMALYAVVLWLTVRLFKRKLVRENVFDIALIIAMLFLVGFVVADIVYLSTPHYTAIELFELEYGPLP
ncbi:hypothetical protein M2132_000872 [Dysgonomonas sp. PH5-45]|uniref:hypothetical protein n=1 Tax=unclassified Dysgonomonas TaxID=2630389 RepID=UPI002475E8B5|nr:MULTISPECIES: hypothetical protein [unclassified Dysgonomonas]MDH6354544.1 hypothetical protein [Dysgonomonas sp. PH5-45]MDH6387400.1 hypothetical protein [Dysgonomonas sp. PH5-37]